MYSTDKVLNKCNFENLSKINTNSYNRLDTHIEGLPP